MSTHKTIITSLLLWLVTACLPCSAQDPRAAELSRAITSAEQYQKQAKHLEAANEYAKAGAAASQIFGANHINVAALAQAQGLLHRQLGEYAKAESLIARGLKIAESVGDEDFIAEAVNNLATVKWEQAAYLEAQALHERSLNLLTQRYGENSPQVAVSRANLAGVSKSLGEYSASEPLLLQSIKTLRTHQPKFALELADGLMNLADLYTVQGLFPPSERLLLEAIQIKERAFGVNHFEVGRTLNNLAALYSSMGQFEKAEQKQKQSLKILETTLGADHPDVGRALVNLAIDYHLQQRYDEAEPLYLRSLSIRQAVAGQEHPDTALAKHNLAGFYTDRRDYPKALALYAEVLATRRQILGTKHPSVAYTLMALGEVRLRQSQFEEAKKLFDEALQIRQEKLAHNHPDLAYTWSKLAAVSAAMKQWESCVEKFDTARRGFRAHVDQVLPSLSESDQLSFLKHTDEPHYHAALSIVLSQLDNADVVAHTANWLLNGKAVAQQALAQRALVARDTRNPQMAAIVKALLVVRKQLASLTMTTSANEEATARQARIDELSRQEHEHSQQLAHQGGRTLGAEAWIETDQVRNALKAKSVLVEIARFRVHDYSKPGTAVEELTERYVAWIIPTLGEGDIRAVDLGDAAEIDQSVRAARTALQAAPTTIREQGEPEAEKLLMPVLKELANRILHPLLAFIQTDQTIYLSPDSLLWLVPWSALPLESDEYAIEKYDIRFVVTGRDLCRTQPSHQLGQLIVFADPDYDLAPADGQTFAQHVLRKPTTTLMPLRAASPTGQFKLGTAARLPGTKAEAEAVLPKLESLAGGKAIVYSQQYALEAIFKELHQPRILMLSTHGFFQEETEPSNSNAATGRLTANPLLRCGLLLAGCNKPSDAAAGDGEDGILTGLEIVSADLRGTDLVVLSACETGLGEVHNGQGVSGLRQAFQLAGARTVVSTLWQIPDRDTAKLMASFFAGLTENADKGTALRNSQLKLIESRRQRQGVAHPFFWAAFTITGE